MSESEQDMSESESEQESTWTDDSDDSEEDDEEERPYETDDHDDSEEDDEEEDDYTEEDEEDEQPVDNNELQDSEEDANNPDPAPAPIVRVSVEAQTETTSVRNSSAQTDSTNPLDDLVTAALEAPPDIVIDLFHKLTSATERLQLKYELALQNKDELIKNFLEKNEEYRCPISRDLMLDPVVTLPPYGHGYDRWTSVSYDRTQIESHIRTFRCSAEEPYDPTTKKRIRFDVMENCSLKQCILRDLKRAKLDVFFNDHS